ncbi:MAG: hypothetical protein IPH22_06060 [Nitrosomonas sp.]|nr:hypothetical protein [Nitrosomonas sp.]
MHMYAQHFNLNLLPFENVPDPLFFYDQGDHARIGKKCLVIMDESHLMSEDVVNGIRLLNNLEEGSTKLIQLLLLGQEELMEMINKPEMAPFKQRIAALETLGKMNVDRVLKYITHRIQVAGGAPNLISDTGWEALSIAFSSGGTPRTINSLCDRSFNVAYERDKPIIDAQDIYEATQRMGLVTDVFHYIILLNNRERKKQESQQVTDSAVLETAPPAPPPPFLKEKPVPSITKKIEQKNRVANNQTPEITEISGAKIDVSEKSYDDIAKTIKAKYEQKGLMVPATLLVLSMIAFMLSVWFFCHRTDSEGFLGCLMDLLGF